jgi:hypothetical protein
MVLTCLADTKNILSVDTIDVFYSSSCPDETRLFAMLRVRWVSGASGSQYTAATLFFTMK